MTHRRSRYRLARRSWLPTFEPLEDRRLMHAGHDPHEFDLDVLPALPEYLMAAPGQAALPASGGATHTLSSVPALNSLPGARATLYLDFDGHFESKWGSYSNASTPAFDQDGDTSTFSDGELAAIRQIWEYVAEDFAPFQINVSTVLPSSFANGVSLRVAIGGDGAWAGGNMGGIGYVSSFTNSIVNTAYVFSANLARGGAKWIADAGSHEAGHGFGLDHQRSYDASGNKLSEYSAGDSASAPIMGASYNSTRGLWWNGPTSSAKSLQDNLSILAGSKNGFGYRPDDHGDSPSAATPLDTLGAVVTGVGLIGNMSDRDYFSFMTDEGNVSLSVSVPERVNNLDATLQLVDATGRVIASAAPMDDFGATIDTYLPAGSYRLVVGSQGSYGDLGTYSVSGTIVPIQRNLLVRGNALAITSGDVSPGTSDGTDFGTVKINADPAGRVFTLVNTGVQSLRLGTLQVTGPAAGDFTIVPPSQTTIGPGESLPLQVVFNPKATGTRTATISLTSDGATPVYTFAVRGSGGKAITTEFIVDDGNSGFSKSGSWTTQKLGYKGDDRYNTAGTGKDTATWKFTKLEPGQYQVFTTWAPYATLATNAPFSIFDNNTQRGSGLVNQRTAPSGVLAGGTLWQSLGTVQISSTTLRVVLSDLADGRVLADAVRIVRIATPVFPGGAPSQLVSAAPGVAAATTSTNSTASAASQPAAAATIGPSFELTLAHWLAFDRARRRDAAAEAAFASTDWLDPWHAV